VNVFSALGAAYGTAKSGTGIAAMAVMRPELIMKSIIPVVMAGIIAIYGLVVAALIAGGISEPKENGYSLFKYVKSIHSIQTNKFIYWQTVDWIIPLLSMSYAVLYVNKFSGIRLFSVMCSQYSHLSKAGT